MVPYYKVRKQYEYLFIYLFCLLCIGGNRKKGSKEQEEDEEQLELIEQQGNNSATYKQLH